LKYFSGQVWENPDKIPSTPKNLPTPTPMIDNSNFLAQNGMKLST